MDGCNSEVQRQLKNQASFSGSSNTVWGYLNPRNFLGRKFSRFSKADSASLVT